MSSALRKTSIVLYVGGIAELFLSSPSEERLYVGKRKGFIKLAMRTGSEIIPCYYFGNTTCLEVRPTFDFSFGVQYLELTRNP